MAATTKRTTTAKARVATLAIAAATVVSAGACSTIKNATAGITESTTCSEYLGFSNEARSKAVRTLGVEAGWKDAGNPMSVLNVDSHCGQRPSQTMGQVFALFAK